MPRLFWKLFFSLWLSIMAFAGVVSWINQTVILQNTLEGSGDGSKINKDRINASLVRELNAGGERRLRQALRELPRGLRRHVFVLDAQGKELLGRDRALTKLQGERVRLARRTLTAANGKIYTVLNARQSPPRALLEPGPRGVGMRLSVAALVSALVSLILARYLATPLTQLSRASRQLATGDLSARVGEPLIQRNDEFGQLALDMDQMAGRLQDSQQANRRLLRDVSHELRSPLARLRVALEIARNKDRNQVAEELNRIELESERLEKLIDEVLGLLKGSSASLELKLQEFDLSDLLQDLVDTVNYIPADAGQQIELQIRPPLILNADRGLLWSVFENLLRNAMIHGGGGEIRIVATSSPQEIVVCVQDSGPGIAEQHLEMIFEPFYRVDEARSRPVAGKTTGHGLGLAIAAAVVKRHDGRITAANRQGGGLEVEVVLPRSSST